MKFYILAIMLTLLVSCVDDQSNHDHLQDIDSLRTLTQAVRDDVHGRRDVHHGPRDSQDEFVDSEESDVLDENNDATEESPNYSVPARTVRRPHGQCTTDLLPRPPHRPHDPTEEARRDADYVPSLWSDDQELPAPAPENPETEAELSALAEIPQTPNALRTLLEEYRAAGCADDRIAHIPRCANHPYILALQQEWDEP